MKMTLHHIISSAALTLALMLGSGVATTVQAARTAAGAMVNAPRSVLPLLDRNTRLDMIDYFNSGSTTASTNKLGGKSLIVEMTPESVTIQMTDASTYQIALMPYAKRDTAVIVIRTVDIPAKFSDVTIYDLNTWRPLSGVNRPEPEAWLATKNKASRRALSEAKLPVMPAAVVYQSDKKQIVYTPTFGDYLAKDRAEALQPFVLKEYVLPVKSLKLSKK